MKLDQLQQAQDLYFRTGLNKSEIAQQTGISRRTIHSWALIYDWDRQKKNAQHMPVYIAENCYHIMGHLTEEILSVDREYEPITTSETNNLYKLVLTINKLNARATANESMQAVLQFADAVAEEDAELANKLMPLMEKYIAAKASRSHTHKPAMNKQGRIPRKDLDTTFREEELDRNDIEAWKQEAQKMRAAAAGQTKDQPANATPTAGSGTMSSNPASTAPSAAQVPGKPPLTIADQLRARELAKPKPDLRKLLRGTSPTGPSKVLRQPLAA